jgi:MSHA biogenesis protein MshP
MTRGAVHGGARRRGVQRGMSLVAALFVVVVLAMLGTFAVRVGAAGQQDVNTELMAARALAAARAGFEFGAYRALSVPPAPCLTHPVTSISPTTLNLTQSALTGFTANVSWACENHMVNGTQYQTFRISVFAQRGTYGTPDYVAQRLAKTVTNAPP